MAPDMFSIGGGDDEAPFIEGPDLPEPLEAPPEDSIDGGCSFLRGTGGEVLCCRSTSLPSTPDDGEMPCLCVGIPPLQSELGKWAQWDVRWEEYNGSAPFLDGEDAGSHLCDVDLAESEDPEDSEILAACGVGFFVAGGVGEGDIIGSSFEGPGAGVLPGRVPGGAPCGERPGNFEFPRGSASDYVGTGALLKNYSTKCSSGVVPLSMHTFFFEKISDQEPPGEDEADGDLLGSCDVALVGEEDQIHGSFGNAPDQEPRGEDEADGSLFLGACDVAPETVLLPDGLTFEIPVQEGLGASVGGQSDDLPNTFVAGDDGAIAKIAYEYRCRLGIVDALQISFCGDLFGTLQVPILRMLKITGGVSYSTNCSSGVVPLSMNADKADLWKCGQKIEIFICPHPIKFSLKDLRTSC